MSQENQSEVRVEKSEEGPVLNVGGTRVLLRTFLNIGRDGVTVESAPLKTEVDYDADFGSWWNLVREDDEEYPWLSIQPEVLTDGQ